MLKHLMLIFLPMISLISHPYDEIISLGCDCEVAHQLQRFNLKKESLPFDWIRSDTFQSVYNLLENNFKDFLSSDYLLISPQRGDAVINSLYNTMHLHDFPSLNGLIVPQFLDALNFIQEKYNRRINRLHDILNSNKTCLIIRCNFITPHESLNLVNLIKAKYPNLQFTIAVIHSDIYYQNDWNVPHVQNIYLPRTASGMYTHWFADFQWEIVFKQLNLIV